MGECINKKHKTSIKNEQIKCSIYGDMTGTDCACAQDEKYCEGCYIYDAMKSVAADLAGEILEHQGSVEVH